VKLSRLVAAVLVPAIALSTLACSRKTTATRGEARNASSSSRSANTQHLPAPPLANGALQARAIAYRTDIQKDRSRPSLALSNDGTIVAVFASSDQERWIATVSTPEGSRDLVSESSMLLMAGHKLAIFDTPTRFVDVVTGKDLGRGEGDTLLGRYTIGRHRDFLGESRDRTWALWSDIDTVPHLYVRHDENTVQLEVRTPQRPNSVAIRNDGKALFIKDERDHAADEWRFGAGVVELERERLKQPYNVVSLHVVSEISDARLDLNAFAGTVAGDGFALGYTDGRIVLTDVTLRSPQRTFTTAASVVALAASPDEKLLASLHANGSVFVWPLTQR
jgi:WD40 repeat protein